MNGVRGCYLVLDGPDGGGKSTMAAELCNWLTAEGRSVLHVREPGSTAVGEALRRLLLDPATGGLRPVTEALLFSAARAELVATVIAPALQQGRVVIAERAYTSTLAYQGAAASPPLDYDWIVDLTRRVHGAVLPDAVFVLDVPPKVAALRRAARQQDRIEARAADYQQRVRDAFRELAAREANVQLIDAAWPRSAVAGCLRAAVARLLP